MSKSSDTLALGKGLPGTTTSFLFTRLLHQIRLRERQPRNLGSIGSFTPSEIHVIQTIGTGRGMIMGQLANRIGVTNGAITQIIDRMENKGLVQRFLMRGSNKVTVILTDKGESVYFANEEFFVKPFDQWIRDELNENELKSFEKGLKKLIEFLNE